MAVLAPATNVVSLDLVPQQPSVETSAPVDTASVATSEVPVAPVEPQVTEYAVTSGAAKAEKPAAKKPAAKKPSRQKAEKPAAPKQATPDAHDHTDSRDHAHGLSKDVDADEVVEATVKAPVKGYGAVGVTWDEDAEVAEGEIALQVRTRVGGEWSGWGELTYHDDHAPDAGSPDAELARAGTDALIVGDVDEVELRADAAGELPEGMSLAVVDPGATVTREEGPAIESQAPAAAGEGQAEGDIELSAAKKKTAVKPTIYSRAQWGANEKLRDKSSLRYGTISAGFVHHTVNANDYSADEVPGIIRSIYAYHTKSRGWSDIGYNFLVDRFGRIWEGRYGGVDKAVVGAHTLGYNDYAFAMSAIGNFETAKPSQSMVDAYGALMAWKLSLAGVDASSTKQKVGKGTFQAINGHRDAGSTACPGKHLYARLGDIRKIAKSAQGGAVVTPPAPTPTPDPAPKYSTPVKHSNLVGTPHPDLVVRRKSDNRLLIIPTGGTSSLRAPKSVSAGWKARGKFFISSDLTGDGRADVVSIDSAGIASVHPGDGQGGFAAANRRILATKNHDLLVPYGDLNGDGLADLVGRDKRTKMLVGFIQKKKGGFWKVSLKRTVKRYTSLTAVGDISGDGRPDLIGREASGTAWTIRGAGRNAITSHKLTPGSWPASTTVAGGGDFTRDGVTDLLVRTSNGTLQVLPGRGNGTFGLPLGPLGVRKNITNLSVGAITATGLPDVVARRGDSLVVLTNPGTFELGRPVGTGTTAKGITAVINAGDFDGDGHGDVISIRDDGALQLRRGNGTGRLANPLRIGTGFGDVKNLEAVGDIDGDKMPDLLGTVSGKTVFYAGRGAKAIAAGVPATGFAGAVGRLKTSSVYDPTLYDWKVAISDAHLAKAGTDLIARDRKTGLLYLFTASSSGLTGRRLLGEGMGAYDLAG
ncbi:FG-GAP-like repeat-containing protein [Nocardioides daphniae]|uniref:FG-GAP-like repeat-containing protein n=1 Tax=Nocardioides daphniae TaxID=402297 RepID=UPI00166F137D|nr:FG-GAP-like repeat-containing protein [Nocardioides daphniae]